jgi:hypothetical protein
MGCSFVCADVRIPSYCNQHAVSDSFNLFLHRTRLFWSAAGCIWTTYNSDSEVYSAYAHTHTRVHTLVRRTLPCLSGFHIHVSGRLRIPRRRSEGDLCPRVALHRIRPDRRLLRDEPPDLLRR